MWQEIAVHPEVCAVRVRHLSTGRWQVQGRWAGEMIKASGCSKQVAINDWRLNAERRMREVAEGL